MTEPLDRSQLSELVQELGQGNVRELVRTFLDTTPVLIADLREAVSDPEQLRSTAHRLKGGALAIGASALAEVSGQLERGGDAVDGALAGIVAVADPIKDSTAQAIREVTEA